MYIEKINCPADVKNLDEHALTALAAEIRTLLIQKLSVHGGHFGPNLGFVEATIALHYVFDSPTDKIVFDVSHQTYAHKMLTGRKDAWLSESHYDDVTGFTNPAESEHDLFTVGHTSTAISLATGLAKARDLTGGTENVIAVIGDGSLSGGEALEALNVAGELSGNCIIVVNDNDMSIAENHGGMYKTLRELRESGGSSPNNLFKAMGLDYRFVKDGNDIASLVAAFRAVKDSKTPVVVHIVTQKGKGYKIAEENREAWHFAAPFDIATGKPKSVRSGENYGDLTADFLLQKMQADKRVAVLTAGTPTVLGFTKEKRDKAGAQFIDVGIAEETATAMASGLAKRGAKPVFGVYSTFFQRCYDQMQQDVCVNGTSATFVVCGASVWGMSDVTHIGYYDIQMLAHIPNLVYLAPTSCEEYFAMLDWAIEQDQFPVAIRQPTNGVIHADRAVRHDYSALNTFHIERHGSGVAVLALGDFFQLGENVVASLKRQLQIDATLVNPVYASGIDTAALTELAKEHRVVVTLEDGILAGGWGQTVASFYGADTRVKVLNYGLKKTFLDGYNADDVLKENRLTAEQIAEDIKKAL